MQSVHGHRRELIRFIPHTVLGDKPPVSLVNVNCPLLKVHLISFVTFVCRAGLNSLTRKLAFFLFLVYMVVGACVSRYSDIPHTCSAFTVALRTLSRSCGGREGLATEKIDSVVDGPITTVKRVSFVV